MSRETIKDSIGKRLRLLRASHQLSQKELCDILNEQYDLQTGERTLRRYEDGENLPSIEVLFAYKDYFKVSFDYLLEGKHVSNDDSFSFVDAFKRLNRLLFSTVLIQEKIGNPNDRNYGKYVFIAVDDETNAYLDKLNGFLSTKDMEFLNNKTSGKIAIGDFDSIIFNMNLPSDQILVDEDRIKYIVETLGYDYSSFKRENLKKMDFHRKRESK